MDEDKLREALTTAKLPTDDVTIKRLGDHLRVLAHLYRARIGEEAYYDAKLHAALVMLEADTAKAAQAIEADERIALVLEAFKPTLRDVETINMFRAVSDAMKTGALMIEPTAIVGRPENLTTRLYLKIWKAYASLKGKDAKLGRDGPVYRFARSCTGLIDPSINFPDPDSFKSLMKAALDRSPSPL